MLQKVSKNGLGLILLVVAMLGLDIPEQVIEDAVAGVAAIVSLALMLWNQLSRSDMKWGLFRK
jgi:hypothetical protein